MTSVCLDRWLSDDVRRKEFVDGGCVEHAGAVKGCCANAVRGDECVDVADECYIVGDSIEICIISDLSMLETA